MMDSRKPTSRRTFLQLGASAGLLARKASGAPPPAGRRDGYRVFSKGRMVNMQLKNRLVRSATAEGVSPDGLITDAGIDLYRGLAEGGVGLIITGHMTVMPSGLAHSTQTCIYDDRFTGAIRKVADAVHQAGDGCKVVAQISHAGMQTPVVEPVGPAAKAWPGRKAKPRALTTREVEDLIANFAQAARRVKEAGFDGVQIHGAHGYLLSSFLSAYTNTRTDDYGGSMENRVRVIGEIVEQARDLVGPDFPILIKMNSNDGVEGGIDTGSFPEVAAQIVKAGIQAVEVSGNNPVRQFSSPDEDSYFLKGVQRLDLSVPVILTGGNRSIERLEAIAKGGAPGFFGLARPLIREPDLPNRWLEGRGDAEATCTSCNECLGALGKDEPVRCLLDEEADA